MGMIKCSSCGAEVDDQYRFCSECGSPIVKPEAAVEAATVAEEAAEAAEAKIEEAVPEAAAVIADTEAKAEEAVADTAAAVEEKTEEAVEAAETAEETVAEAIPEPAAPAAPYAPVAPAPVEPVAPSEPAVAPAAIFAQPAPSQPAFQPQQPAWGQPVPQPIPQGKPAKVKKAKKQKNVELSPDGQPVKKKGAGKAIALILIIVAALALVLGGVYFLFLREDKLSLPEYTEKSFCKILTKDLDMDEDEDFVIEGGKKLTTVTSTDEEPYFSLAIYKNEDKAQKAFDGYYNNCEDVDGDFSHKGGSGTEYFTVNGETDDGDIYGGVYLNGNTVIIVYTQSTRGADTKKVDEILEALDLPTP